MRRLTAAIGTAAAVASTLVVATPAAQAAVDSTGFPCDPGYYRITAVASGLAVEVSQASDNYGAVAQFRWNNLVNQRWRVCHTTEPDGKQIYKLVGWRDRCMVVDQRYLGAGAWVITDHCDETSGSHIGNNAQEFWLVKAPGTDLLALSPQHTQNSTRMWVATQDHSTAAAAQIVQSMQPDLFRMEPIG
ncbi:RICIN domain-containing protein [Kitasatospora sp. NPDC048239]|uniref:RICIN domain-containing protein n=1 Tax=Kitasatospora sp. NPDC048239 TaxID=3364046 RepID=UPI00371CAFD3